MNKRICSLILSLFFILICPVSALADVASASNATESNPDPYGLATMDLTDEDYGISLLADDSGQSFLFKSDYYSVSDNSWAGCNTGVLQSGGYVKFPTLSSDYYYRNVYLETSFVKAGDYNISLSISEANIDLDFASGFMRLFSSNDFASSSEWFSGQKFDSIELSTGTKATYSLNLTTSYNDDSFYIGFYFSNKPSGLDFIFEGYTISFGHLDSVNNSVVSSAVSSSTTSALSDISSSIGDMSESLDSAAESLEYISTSQNLIIQGIDNVIMHISDQLYAFWDQLYNLIHEPTYAKLEQILAALKAIANNSDISAVVDTIEETTEEQIANDNANTAKVEEAVEKHGNFIIEGLKGLFIPSDEYFKSYFDDLYEYFSDRFGFLSFPIDLLVRLIDLFMNSSDTDCVLVLPALEISGEQLMTEQSFNLTEFLEQHFGFVLSSIRMVTSIGLIMAFVHLCQDKWNEVMRN